jgi:hypothetical protein
MTFFNWSGNNSKARVSSYIWIYIVVTALFTAGTIGMWYFVVIYRRTNYREMDPEKQIGYEDVPMWYRIMKKKAKMHGYRKSLFKACFRIL